MSSELTDGDVLKIVLGSIAVATVPLLVTAAVLEFTAPKQKNPIDELNTSVKCINLPHAKKDTLTENKKYLTKTVCR